MASTQLTWDKYHEPDPDEEIWRQQAKTSNGDIGKRLLNAPPDAQRQLEPIKYAWAYHSYQVQEANFWLPSEVPMGEDIEHFKNRLGDRDREAVKRTLAMFSCFEFEIANNLAINLYRLIENPECRMFLLAQGNIEAVHQQAYSLMVECLGVDSEYAYSGHKSMDTVRNKTEWCDRKTKELSDTGFKADTLENKRKLLSNLLAFLLTEGVGFYGGFAILMSMKRRGMMPGMHRQVVFIARDENLHCMFATRLAMELIREEAGLWDENMARSLLDMAQEMLDMELEFVRFAIGGEGLPGLPYDGLKDHLGFLVNKRLDPFGLALEGMPKDTPLKWLSEAVELKQEVNFFEGRVGEYRRGGLVWDD